MLSEYLASEEVQKALEVLKNQFPLAIWETVYVTLLSTLFAIVIGLPLGVLLVAGENKKILRIPQGVLHVINVIINLLRSVPHSYDNGFSAHKTHCRNGRRHACNGCAARYRCFPVRCATG